MRSLCDPSGVRSSTIRPCILAFTLCRCLWSWGFAKATQVGSYLVMLTGRQLGPIRKQELNQLCSLFILLVVSERTFSIELEVVVQFG